jgi:hypothetical protein
MAQSKWDDNTSGWISILLKGWHLENFDHKLGTIGLLVELFHGSNGKRRRDTGRFQRQRG